MACGCCFARRCASLLVCRERRRAVRSFKIDMGYERDGALFYWLRECAPPMARGPTAPAPRSSVRLLCTSRRPALPRLRPCTASPSPSRRTPASLLRPLPSTLLRRLPRRPPASAAPPPFCVPPSRPCPAFAPSALPSAFAPFPRPVPTLPTQPANRSWPARGLHRRRLSGLWSCGVWGTGPSGSAACNCAARTGVLPWDIAVAHRRPSSSVHRSTAHWPLPTYTIGCRLHTYPSFVRRHSSLHCRIVSQYPGHSNSSTAIAVPTYRSRINLLRTNHTLAKQYTYYTYHPNHYPKLP